MNYGAEVFLENVVELMNQRCEKLDITLPQSMFDMVVSEFNGDIVSIANHSDNNAIQMRVNGLILTVRRAAECKCEGKCHG